MLLLAIGVTIYIPAQAIAINIGIVVIKLTHIESSSHLIFLHFPQTNFTLFTPHCAHTWCRPSVSGVVNDITDGCSGILFAPLLGAPGEHCV